MRRTSCNPRINFNGTDTTFDISSLTLNARSPRRSFQPEDHTVSSPALSIASSQTDRSIEPMSVSDISDRELGDDAEDFCRDQPHHHDADACSTTSVGTQWLWSVKSAVSQSSSTIDSLTQPKNIDDDGDGSDTDSDQLSVPSVKTDSMKHVKIVKHDPPTGRYCCTCKQVMHFLPFVAIMLGMLMLMEDDVNLTFCKDGLNFDLNQLEADLKKNVFGQHIAITAVLHHIKVLLSSAEKNITVLSFNGWTGIGKNYVSSFIGARIREANTNKIIIPLEFAHARDSESHQDQMMKRLIGGVAKCQVNLFIIDEVDKATSGTIEGLRRGLQNLTTSRLERTKVIVLLLSNSGGSAINRYLLDQLSLGGDRESLNHEDVLKCMLQVNAAQVEQDWYAPLYEDGIIDVIIPFLPLEKSHVSQCTDHYIRETRPMLGLSDRSDIIERVLEQMSFFPHGMEIFSSTGCRGVSFKVDLTVD
ncbi:hypothetical protein LSH36_314g03039 [Paralvinella palmiformis]|uniref:Torsin-1A C-terminal domain-containing protein n=1 Tax=Paralvinella palmiformis TaxID=53620 RepID=A0AAD9JGW4_9ANNE|nr:hypothetical protein LSH36_314g03039 [Paralvinella palmiformis]